MTLNLKEHLQMVYDLKKRREEMGFVCADCGSEVKGHDYKAKSWYYTPRGQVCHECGKDKDDPWPKKK